MSDFSKRSEHKSHKEYVCYLCGETIKKRTRYIKTVQSYRGAFFSDKAHLWCMDFANENYKYSDDWEAHDPYEFKKSMIEASKKCKHEWWFSNEVVEGSKVVTPTYAYVKMERIGRFCRKCNACEIFNKPIPIPLDKNFCERHNIKEDGDK